MGTAGILLTGGRSRRMGADKAAIRFASPGQIGDRAPGLAERTARLLQSVTETAVEVGPRRTHLPAVSEQPAGSGPLAAVAAGWEFLSSGGCRGPVLVVATDLPQLTAGLLAWLARHPGPGSVVPVSGGRVQPLCARYSPADLAVAAQLVADGARAMTDLLQRIEARLAGEDEWVPAAGSRHALDDVDTPADLARARRLAGVHPAGESGETTAPQGGPRQ